MKLDPRTVLIPIDVQRGFDGPSWDRRNNPDMEANGQCLLAAWRKHGWPLIHVRHDSINPVSTLHPSHPGNAFRPGFEPRDGEPVVGKSVNAAFIGTDLELRLHRLDVKTIVLFGLWTDMCVSTTARVASNLGFRTMVVADASACSELTDSDGSVIPAEAVSRAHLATLRTEFAEVANADDVIEALRVAHTGTANREAVVA
ncbi:MAG: cysteine hydrolase [Gammaproteobacteria bacterium]|nr:cysteine hydrolase [Gammaproteobacteria bacterium]